MCREAGVSSVSNSIVGLENGGEIGRKSQCAVRSMTGRPERYYKHTLKA